MHTSTIVMALALGALLTPLAATGQPAAVDATVDELVVRALTENLELQAMRAEVEAASARTRQAALRPNPLLELGGQKAVGPDSNLTIGLVVPLDLNGRKEGRVGVAERETDVKVALLADRERRLRADVRLRAGEVLVARRNLEVADSLLAVNKEGLALIHRRVGEGAATPLEESVAQVEIHRLEASRELLVSRIEIALLMLRATVGMPAETRLGLRGELAASGDALAGPADVAATLDRRPDLVAARAEVAAAEARVRKEEAEGRWDASVNVGYQRQDMSFNLRGLTDSGGTRPIQDVFHYFGGGISVTLPVRNRNQGNIAAARAEATAAERRRNLMELVARQEIESALTQHAAARRAREVYERRVREVARRNLAVVREAYQLGRGSLLEVVAEQRRYVEIEQGYTDVLKQVWDTAVEIERTGAPGPR